MRGAVHVDVIGAAELLGGDHVTHGGAERFRTTTGQRVESCFTQRDEHVRAAHLLDARDVCDFDGGERLDVHLRVPLLERAEQRLVILEPRLHIEATDDVKLAL